MTKTWTEDFYRRRGEFEINILEISEKDNEKLNIVSIR